MTPSHVPDPSGRTWHGEITGHRGAAGLAPENTLEGFEAGIAAGAECIEFDVRATADGLVVFHDQRLDRFVPGASFARGVGRRSTAEMTAVDVGAVLGRPGCHVPTFEATLDRLLGRVRLNVEVKGSGVDGLHTLTRTLAALAARDLQGSVMLSSFHEPIVAAAARQAPTLPRALILGRKGAPSAPEAAARLECEALHAEHDLVDHVLVTRCEGLGLKLRAWTVNEEDDMDRLILLGVDGIITDRPDRLAALVGSGPA